MLTLSSNKQKINKVLVSKIYFHIHTRGTEKYVSNKSFYLFMFTKFQIITLIKIKLLDIIHWYYLIKHLFQKFIEIIYLNYKNGKFHQQFRCFLMLKVWVNKRWPRYSFNETNQRESLYAVTTSAICSYNIFDYMLAGLELT